MAVIILAGDMVKKEYVKSTLANEYGSNNGQINKFINGVFDGKEEITFQRFITCFFQYVNMCQLSNEALKRAAKSYRERYGEESHLCYDCGKSCDCGGNKENCFGCGCLK